MIIVLLAATGLTACQSREDAATEPPAALAATATPAVTTGAPDPARVPPQPPDAKLVEHTAVEVTFALPSRNIVCHLAEDGFWAGPGSAAEVEGPGARCDIKERNWDVPAQRNCDLDYGHAFQIGVQGPAVILCAGDALPAAREILRYGHAYRVGGIVCASSEHGVRCHNEESDRGFTLSRREYTLF